MYYVRIFFFFLSIRRTPRSTRTDTLFPSSTLFLSASPSLPVPAASTFSTMSALLFDYTNDLIATLLGRHVDEHVGMILGDDAIHREGEWIGVRELIECRQHTVGKILVITHYARDRSHLRRCLHARAKEAIRVVANFVPVDGWYAAPQKE